jgi:hypothetical protein
MGKVWAYFQGLVLYIVWAFGYREAFDYSEAFGYGCVYLSDFFFFFFFFNFTKFLYFLLLYPWLKPKRELTLNGDKLFNRKPI